MKRNLIEDLSKAYNIDEGILAKIFEGMSWCIGEAVYEGKLADETETDVDMGFATLVISLVNGKLRMSFIPKDSLIGDLKAISDGKDPRFKIKLEKVLKENLVATFKNID